MDKVKKAIENMAKLEDTKIMDIDSKINALQVERTFHVGLHTAYLNSLAELEKSEQKQDFVGLPTSQDRM